jgi:TctA family transporter
MVSNANDLTVFVRRPVSAVVLLLSALMVLWPALKAWPGDGRRRLQST